MDSEQIPSASFSAFGFAKIVTFGFFDFVKKQYDPGSFETSKCQHYRNAGLERWQTFSSCARGRLRSSVRVRWRPSSGFRGRNWIT